MLKHFSKSRWPEFYFLLFNVLLIGLIFNKQLLLFALKLNAPGLQGFLFKLSLISLVFIIVLLGLLPFYLVNLTKIGALSALFIASAASYFMDSYGIIYDESVMQSLFETSSAEAFQYFNLWHVIHIIFLSFGLTVFLALLPLQKSPLKQRGTYALKTLLNISLVLLVSTVLFYKDYASLFRNNRQLRHMLNPVSPIYETIKVFSHDYFPRRQKFVDLTARVQKISLPRRRVFVFVLGETVRADHLSLNGYGKDTNPLLRKQNITSFENVESCGTATATSVPCIFSGLGRKNFDQNEFGGRSNLLDIIQASGYKTTWIDNNTGCKGVCLRTDSLDLTLLKTPELCPSHTCYDEILLKGLKTVTTTTAGDQFVVLHMLGSHGPSYYQRYPEKFRHFQPDCQTSDLSQCSKDQIINTYDNTLVYTDYVLNSVIEYLKNLDSMDTALFYVSDHGESLGENGVYLHSLPYMLAPRAQKHVPLLLWLSESYRHDLNNKNIHLDQQAKCSLSHDNIFHTLLSALDIKTPLHDAKLDIALMNPKTCLAER